MNANEFPAPTAFCMDQRVAEFVDQRLYGLRCRDIGPIGDALLQEVAVTVLAPPERRNLSDPSPK
jgi:hypothetical protein